MKTLEMTVVVGPDRTVTLRLPPDIMPGEHQIVVVIDDPKRNIGPPVPMAELRIPPAKALPPDVNLQEKKRRREDDR